METKCDICEFVNRPNPKTRILSTDNWFVELGTNQAYFGRAYVQLRKHKTSLSELTSEEWQDFQVIVKRLETTYKELYGAEPLNWSCLMNLAFRTKPFNPHVHWHIYPRYKVPPTLDGISYDDPLYGNFYDNKIERNVDKDTLEKIAFKLTEHLSNK